MSLSQREGVFTFIFDFINEFIVILAAYYVIALPSKQALDILIVSPEAVLFNTIYNYFCKYPCCKYIENAADQ